MGVVFDLDEIFFRPDETFSPRSFNFSSSVLATIDCLCVCVCLCVFMCELYLLCAYRSLEHLFIERNILIKKCFMNIYKNYSRSGAPWNTWLISIRVFV